MTPPPKLPHQLKLPAPDQPMSYEVGYSKPPLETRFRKGQSGNPKGRPRGAKNRVNPIREDERLQAIILEEAYRTVTINDVKGRTTIPMAQAVMRSLAVNAAKGLQRSQRLFTELVASIENSRRELNNEFLEAAINYKVEWERELDRRARLGIGGEDPLPHPDHVIIDMNEGTAHIRGPATKEEKRELERWPQLRVAFATEIAELRASHADANCTDQTHELEAQIAKTEKALKIIEAVISSGRPPRGFPALDEFRDSQ
jgi:hypothetical protein